MHSVPVTVLDGFFTNPDLLVEYANTLEFFDNENNYAGSRSLPMSEINPDLEHKVLNKYFHLLNWDVDGAECSMHFQKIPSKFELGCPHVDLGETTGIIYLSKGHDNQDCGTSIFDKTDVLPEQSSEEKRTAIANGESLKPVAEKIRQNYTESVNVKFKYNRLITFDGSVYHSQNDLSLCDDRLTLIFFLRNIRGGASPVTKMRQIEGI